MCVGRKRGNFSIAKFPARYVIAYKRRERTIENGSGNLEIAVCKPCEYTEA